MDKPFSIQRYRSAELHRLSQKELSIPCLKLERLCFHGAEIGSG
jgi:hypothetical protein